MLDRDPATRWSMEDAAHALHRISNDHRERTTTLTDRLPAGSAGAGTAGVAGSSAHEADKATAAARTATVAPAPGSDRDGEPGGRRRSPVGPVLLGVLALAAAVLAVLLLDPGGSDPAGGQDAARDAATPQPSPSGEGQQPPREDDPPAPDRTGGQAPASDPIAFVDRYYDTVPDDLDAGWAMLSPDYQAQVGRASYDGFWSTIESVDARGLRAVAGGDAVEATVVFVNGDGETLTERHRVDVVDEGGGPLIAGDEAI
jgi:hypothetical protein